MKNDLKKRILCVFLTLALVLGNVPVTVLAEEEDVPAAEEALLAETTPTSEPETEPETIPETAPETTEETVPETTGETVPETTEETAPETIEAPEAEALEDEISDAFAAAAAGTESGTCGSNLTWTLESGTLTISGTGEMDEFFPYRSSPWSSHASSIVRVVVQTGVTSLAKYSFEDCTKLTSVTLADSITSLGDFCFDNCSNLISIRLPDALTYVGDFCFYGCTSLSSITIAGDASAIGSRVGYECPNLSEIILLEGTTTLPKSFFYDMKNLTRIVLPDSLTSIGENCFKNCTNLTAVNIPKKVSSIGAYAFDHCTSLASITLPEGITSLGEYCFNSCTSLTYLHIPNSVTSLGQYCLADCSKLASVHIPEGLTALPYGFFYRCAALEDFTVPDSVTSLGEDCFNGCASLTSINIPRGITTLAARCFMDCSGLTSISIPDSVIVLKGGCLSGCSGLKSVTIPDTVTSVGGGCFHGCYNLTSITLPRGITSLGSNFFFGCESLKSVDLPDGITSLGSECFSYCSSLVSITLPDGISSLSDYCFNQCTGLSSVTLPKNLTSLGKYCFSNCSSLTSIALPDSLESMGEYCFASCYSLTSVTIPDKISTLEPYCFASCRRLTSVTLPDKLDSLGQRCFSACTALNAIVIPDGVTTLGYECFYNCTGLVSINFPDSLTLIGNSCFRDCTSLQAFDLSAIPTLIQDRTPLPLTNKVTVPKVFGKMIWKVETIPGEVDVALVARVSTNTSGEEQLEFIGSGRFRLVLLNEFTCARASTVLEVETSLSVDAKQDFLFSGGKLPLTAVDLTDGSHPAVQWTVMEGASYATVTSGGVLTAGAVSEEQTVTVSATTVGRSERAYRRFRILPKSDGVFLTTEGNRLQSALNLDMRERKTLTLSAYTPSVEEPLDVVWSSSNPKIASVDQNTGEVTLNAPGSAVITATAADGSGVKTSVTLNVIYLDAAKTLTASADVPAIGLQPGQTATMIVSGEYAIDPAMLDYATSNSDIASVSSQGIVTAGTKAGTATITATLKGDPLNRKATVKIPVIAMQAQTLTLTVYGAEMSGGMYLAVDADRRGFQLAASAADYNGNAFTPSVTWTSSDTSVATVDKAGVLTIPAGASGACVVTATANDLNKASAQLTISVRDYSPRLATDKITLNGYSEQGVVIDLRESYGNAIVSAELTGAPAGLWLDDMTLYAQAVTNGTYYPQLLVACEDGNTYSYKLQVKVASTLPAVTVKQTEKLNLFYTDSTASLSITAPGQTITDVVLTGTPDFQVEEEADGVYVLSRTDTQPKKLTTRATLEVELDGWSAPVTKAITISTATTAPKLSLTPASAVVRQADGIDPEVTLQVVDAEGNSIDPLYIACTPDFADVEKNAQSLVLTLTKQNSKGVYTGGTASLQVQLPTWTKPVVLKCKVTVSTKSPTMKLGTASLTLRHYFPEEAAQTVVTLDQSNLALEDVMIISTSKASAEAAKLDVTYENGVITARIKDATQLPKVGTYTYSCTGKTDAGDTKSVTLKVAVSAAQPKVTLSAKGKLDTLNPDSAIVYTPKLTNCVSGIDGVSLAGQDNGKFHAELADGKIVLTLRDGEDYATNVTYKVQFSVSVCGKEIVSPVMNIKVTQSKVKLTAAPAALTLYQSQSASLWATLTQSAGEIGDVAISGKTSPELLAALGENGLNAVPEGNTAALELTVENAALLKAGKSYTLYLDVTPRNNAQNLKPNQIKLTVKVAK